MENYFKYYKGYKRPVVKKYKIYIYYAILILSIATVLLGSIAIIIAASKGKTLSYITENTPMVIPMTIGASVIMLASLGLVLLTTRKNADYASYSVCKVIVDEESNEAIELYYKIDDNLVIKGNKLINISKDNIKLVSVDDIIKLNAIIDNEEYYILIEKKDDILNWIGGDSLE